MRITYNVKHRHATRLKIVGKFLTSLNKSVGEEKSLSTLQLKKVFFYIVVNFIVNLNIFHTFF